MGHVCGTSEYDRGSGTCRKYDEMIIMSIMKNGYEMVGDAYTERLYKLGQGVRVRVLDTDRSDAYN